MPFKIKLLFLLVFWVGCTLVYLLVLGFGGKILVSAFDLDIGPLKEYGIYIIFLLGFVTAVPMLRLLGPNMIGELESDHSHFSDALALLEEEANRLTTFYDDTSIVTGLLDYLAGYPGGPHCAREAVVFAAVTEKDPGAASLTASLNEEHELLSQLAQALAVSLPGNDKPTSASPEVFLEQVRDFCDRHRAHSDRENEVFRRARKLLSDADWERLEKEAPAVPDPLFGDNVPEKYKAARLRLIPGDSGSGDREDEADDEDKPGPAVARS
jgi:hemerythrin-like domain-containing protein